MTSQALIAKNKWDIAAYIELTTCDVCQEGPLCPTHPLPEQIPLESSSLAVKLTCSLCGSDQTVEFQVPFSSTKRPTPTKPQPTDHQPSSIVDLAGWLTLFQIYLDRSKQTDSAADARKLALSARRCLDEGLLLYDANDDAPPPEAFFSLNSLARFQAQPQHYSRQRLINLRAPLPKHSPP